MLGSDRAITCPEGLLKLLPACGHRAHQSRPLIPTCQPPRGTQAPLLLPPSPGLSSRHRTPHFPQITVLGGLQRQGLRQQTTGAGRDSLPLGHADNSWSLEITHVMCIYSQIHGCPEIATHSKIHFYIVWPHQVPLNPASQVPCVASFSRNKGRAWPLWPGLPSPGTPVLEHDHLLKKPSKGGSAAQKPRFTLFP